MSKRFKKHPIHRRQILLLIVAVVLLIGAIVYFFNYKTYDTYDPAKVDDRPGGVLGDNPRNIPESKLPECRPGGRTGHDVVPQPCYAKPGFYIF